MNVIERILMLKKIVKEAERIAAWQADIYTALHNIDASWVVSGVFPVGRGGTGLSTIALGGILYASALNTLSRLAPTASNQVLRSTAANALQFAALIANDIPNLNASKINAGTFPVARGGTGLSTIALGGILYASALDTLSRLAPTASNQVLRSTAANALQFAALVAADIPNLPASKITSEVFELDRIPSGIQDKLTAPCPYQYTHPGTPVCSGCPHPSGRYTHPGTPQCSGCPHPSGRYSHPSTPPCRAATAAQTGHATATQISKLDGIEAEANKYIHPTTGSCPQTPKSHSHTPSYTSTNCDFAGDHNDGCGYSCECDWAVHAKYDKTNSPIS